MTSRPRPSLDWNAVRRLLAVAALLGAGAGAAIGHFATVDRERATVQDEARRLEAVRRDLSAERAELSGMNARADALARELARLRRRDEELRRAIGAAPGPRPAAAAVPTPPATRTFQDSALPPAGSGSSPVAFRVVADRLERIETASREARIDAGHLSRLVGRVLSARRLAALAHDRLLAAIPSIDPVGPSATIGSGFGYRTDPAPEFHDGVDLDIDLGSPVVATADGTVVAAAPDGGYGLKIDIDHHNGFHTWYAHLSETDVHPGEIVRKGQRIGAVGMSGYTTGPHLHYQVMENGQAVDPAPFLRGVPPRVLAALK